MDTSADHDAQIAAWVDAQPRQLTFTELAAACRAAFGPEHAWDADRLRRYWHTAHQVMTRSPIERDAELLAFLRERMGRLTVAELLRECSTRYAAGRVPSRSALYRWISRERSRMRQQREAQIARA